MFCKAGILDDSSRLDVVDIARVPDMLPSLLTLPNYLLCIQKLIMNYDSAVNDVGSEMNVAASSDFLCPLKLTHVCVAKDTTTLHAFLL